MPQQPGVVHVPTFEVHETRPRTDRFKYRPAHHGGHKCADDFACPDDKTERGGERRQQQENDYADQVSAPRIRVFEIPWLTLMLKPGIGPRVSGSSSSVTHGWRRVVR